MSDVFCCLGTTIARAGSQSEFYKVDFTYVTETARLAAVSGARQILLVSAVGADPSSHIFYSRVKGEVEEAIKRLPFDGIHIFRPSILSGNRAERRPGSGSESASPPRSRSRSWGPYGSTAPWPPPTSRVAMVVVARQDIRGAVVYGSERYRRDRARLHALTGSEALQQGEVPLQHLELGFQARRRRAVVPVRLQMDPLRGRATRGGASGRGGRRAAVVWKVLVDRLHRRLVGVLGDADPTRRPHDVAHEARKVLGARLEDENVRLGVFAPVARHPVAHAGVEGDPEDLVEDDREAALAERGVAVRRRGGVGYRSGTIGSMQIVRPHRSRSASEIWAVFRTPPSM